MRRLACLEPAPVSPPYGPSPVKPILRGTAAPVTQSAGLTMKSTIAQPAKGKVRKPINLSRLFWSGLIALFPGAAHTTEPFPHDLFDAVLQTYVDGSGRVDYTGLKSDRGPLDAYIDSLGRISPRSNPDRFPAPQHELAYWINAYNAFVLKGVIDAYPVVTVMDIEEESGFFSKIYFLAGGEKLTLDQVEHEIIRPNYREPRIHFAVNCAAASCPSLENLAFRGEGLEVRLEAALQRFAGTPSHVRLDKENNLLHLSKIMQWFGTDFVEWFPLNRDNLPAEPTLIDYLLPYLTADDAAYLRQSSDVDISFNIYDWTLNDQLAP